MSIKSRKINEDGRSLGMEADALGYIQPGSRSRLRTHEQTANVKPQSMGLPRSQLARKGRARPSQDFRRMFSRTWLYRVSDYVVTPVRYENPYGNWAPSQQAMETYPKKSLKDSASIVGSIVWPLEGGAGS